MTNLKPLQQFRDTVYTVLPKRADATLDLVDALTAEGQVTSPVALSESPLFRRKFSSVYDVLEEGEIPEAQLGELFYQSQQPEFESLAGLEVYAVDCTPDYRPEAETLADRTYQKSSQNQIAQPGHKLSYLARLVKENRSWVAPQDIRRVPSTSTDSQIAVEQVQTLDKQSDKFKVVVADSLYGNHIFLSIFLIVQTVYGLVRLRSNLKLYEEPEPKPAKAKGRPRLHGQAFKMKTPHRQADRTETITILGQAVRLSAWQGLHLRQLPTLVGLLLIVEFLKPNGQPRYKTPMYLYWTGPWTVPLGDLCRMYLWRFALEHAFRFCKQKLGLTARLSTSPHTVAHWPWLVALAYWQLLLMAPIIDDHRPAWNRRPLEPQPYHLPPGQVQRGALSFLLQLGTPATTPRPAGKGSGRPVGYRPQPRKRHPVIRKERKQTKKRPKVVQLAV